MYAGELVETAPADRLAANPQHPYTQGLLQSFPPLGGPLERLTGIPGSPPDLRDPPSGCRFHPRCPHAFARCPSDEPPLLELAGGRGAACWLQQPGAPPANLGPPANVE